MPLPFPEISEIMESSTIVREAMEGTTAIRRTGGDQLRRSNRTVLSDRERASSSIQTSSANSMNHIATSASASGSEAINHSVSESLSNLRSQSSSELLEQTGRVESEFFATDLASAVRAARLRQDRISASQPVVERSLRSRSSSTASEIFSTDSEAEQPRNFLYLQNILRQANNIRNEIERFRPTFDQFVSYGFPLPSYEEAVRLPRLPRYSSSTDMTQLPHSDLPGYSDIFK